eukprot:1741499-Pyramimonas_sp.AAC.1
MDGIAAAKKRASHGAAAPRAEKTSGRQECGGTNASKLITRDYLVFKQEAKSSMDAKALAMLFRAEETKQTMVHLAQQWEGDKPEPSEQQKKDT